MMPPNNPESVSVPPKAEGVETQKAAALTSIICERQRQDEKWGEQNHDPFTYIAVLIEEVGEFAQAALHHRFGGREAFGMRQEAVQVAAVALAIIECIDRAKWAWPLHAGETAPRADSLSFEKAHSVGRGNAANEPPGNPEASTGFERAQAALEVIEGGKPILAAAAEDVAGEEWKVVMYDGNWYIQTGDGNKIDAPSASYGRPKRTCDAHNSCVSRLQEQIKTATEKAMADERLRWQNVHADFVRALKRAKTAEEQIKTLKVKLETAADYLMESASRITSLSARAEEAETKLANLIDNSGQKIV